MGVLVGDISFNNYMTQTCNWNYSGKYSATDSFPNILANWLRYVFNPKEPSLLVNSACISSMYALHLAITSMRNGDCDPNRDSIAYLERIFDMFPEVFP
jgi:acyl transferase domain-containing protein